jgi:hypothetical protein
MKWPDDYIPEGFTPFYIEPAGIIFNCDCRDILPHLPRVDLVLRNSLLNNTISDTISSKKGGCCNGQRKTAGRNQAEDGSGQQIMGESPGRNPMALSRAELVSGDDCGILPSISNGLEQGIEEVGYSIAEQGEKGELKRQIQRWVNEHPLQINDSERQVLEMFCNGGPRNSPQEWRPSRQSLGKPTSSVQQLSHQTAQKTMVENEKIVIITDPPYGNHVHDKHLSSVADRQKLGFDSIDRDSLCELASLWCNISNGWVVFTCDWAYVPFLPNLVRFGVWIKPNGAPQFTGDRPGTGWEAVAILHRPGKKILEWWRSPCCLELFNKFRTTPNTETDKAICQVDRTIF